MAFIGSFLLYLIKAVILLAIGLCGGAIGIRLRRNKDAKLAAEQKNEV